MTIWQKKSIRKGACYGFQPYENRKILMINKYNLPIRAFRFLNVKLDLSLKYPFVSMSRVI